MPDVKGDSSPDIPDVMGQGAYGTPYIDCECSIDSRFVMVYGHHMSDGSAFAPFASYIDAGFAREHARIIVYRRTGETLELKPIAVDVVNASQERLVIDEEPCEEGQLFAFTTCSYQTRNSRTTVYAAGASEAH